MDSSHFDMPSQPQRIHQFHVSESLCIGRRLVDENCKIAHAENRPHHHSVQISLQRTAWKWKKISSANLSRKVLVITVLEGKFGHQLHRISSQDEF